MSIEQNKLILPEHAEAVRAAAALLSEEVRAEFELRFSKWEDTWSKSPLSFSSNSRDYCKSPEYDALLELGSVTLPAVVEKLLQPEYHFALHLYEALQPQQNLVEQGGLAEGQQGRAARIVVAFAKGLSPEKK